MKDFITELKSLNVGIVKENEPLSSHTTIKIGGPADLFIEPSSVENLIKTMALVQEYQMNWRVIGRGSNLLVSDKGIEGVVIKLGEKLNQVDIAGTEIKAGAGYSLISLAISAGKQGLTGLEFASGIPGCVYECRGTRFRYFEGLN